MHDVSLWTLVCINEHIDIDNAHDNHDSNYCDYHWDNNNDGDNDDDDDDDDNNNKAVIDRRLRPRCCHLGSYFQHMPFSCCYIHRDIMCKRDVINIQHTHCGLVGPDCKK